MSLAEYAKTIVDRLEKDFPKNDLLTQQTLCLAEEVGEFVQAARRFLGMARTPGNFDAVKLELADVVLAAYVTAETFGIDMGEVLHNRLREIEDRGGY